MKFLEGHTVGIDLGTTYSSIAMQSTHQTGLPGQDFETRNPPR